jgi:hypothetical protein
MDAQENKKIGLGEGGFRMDGWLYKLGQGGQRVLLCMVTT